MDSSNPKSEIRNPKPALRPPQFGLRSLLLLVTACAVLAALSRWVSPIALAALAFLVLSIIAHMAGNAIGTRLRELGSKPAGDEETSAAGYRNRFRPQAGDFAPATRLGERHALGWPIVIATLGGIVAGGIGGAVWTLLASRGPVGPLNIAVGAVAFAVLGGIASFAAFGFVQVGLGAIRQAMTNPPSRPVSHDESH